MNRKRLFFVSVWLIGFVSSWVTAWADVRLPAIISDHMVLQRNMPVKIWGWASPGENISVTIAGQQLETHANASGAWSVTLRAISERGPYELTVRGTNALLVQDVLVGEVWLASGQSNMQMAISSTAGFTEERARASRPELRMFNTVHKTAREPQSDCEGRWIVCAPDTLGVFSGTAYYFGRDLQERFKVPVGIIHSSYGGSPIEAFTSLAPQTKRVELKPLLTDWETKDRVYNEHAAREKYEKALAEWQIASQKAKAKGQKPVAAPKKPLASRDDNHHPAVLFNAIIAPMIPYTIRGAIWYQGESNGHSEESARLYAAQLPLLIEDWRNRWGQGDFPFAWVQLPNYSDRDAACWPWVRESMTKALAITNTGMVVAYDLGSTNTIHPLNKRDVGARLALWARAKVYGENIVWSGPMLVSAMFKDGQAELIFTNSAGSLKSRNDALLGFVVAGDDKKFVPATAQIEGDKVVLTAIGVSHPVAVRFAWAANPDANLVNAADLPAWPFRTDDWNQ